MKEILFIRNNIDKWERAEAMAEDLSAHTPDEIADTYIDVTADLAFAYTHYPSSRITQYLNNLAATLHGSIYRRKRERWSRVVTFWTHEVPLVMHDARRLLLASLLVFLCGVGVGVLSQSMDPHFCEGILGSDYVDMTVRNIERGQPMAVYGSGGETEMFLGITINNVGVALRTFALGLFTSLASGWCVLSNGVMMGCFETLFAQHGLLGQSLLAVMLHGTLELSAIVVAGAAGLSLGNGWLMPGTYTRAEAFRRGAKRGLKIVVGTVPIFIVAAFVEGFVTRHTEMDDVARLTIILLSAAFITYYYYLLPRKRHNQLKTNDNDKTSKD